MSTQLELESEEVRMVGIWGSSGIGKTIIARALFNRLSRHFQGKIFIDRGFVSKSKKTYSSANPDDLNMKLHLQGNFLSEIMGIKDIKIDHLGALEERLRHKKVLIVIDDLDDLVVLDVLAGKSQWFGSGSRIIMVTNDKSLLIAHAIDHIYEVFLPSEECALEMLCQSAFRQNSPPEGFHNLATEVVRHAGSLPLGLTVLGSSLRGKDKKYWIDMLPRLQNGLDEKIEKTLRLSYDGLGSEQDKAIFRYIACLSSGMEVQEIKLLLADSNLGVDVALKNVSDKSLIHIREGHVEMHRLLQEMGRKIVHTQSPTKPGKREFLVNSKDISDVLIGNTGTDKVIGISLDMCETEELHIHTESLRGMRNLNFLNICSNSWLRKGNISWHISEDFDCLPPKLRLLRLDGYPMRHMPSNFRPENLVNLKMRYSNLEKLWDGVPSLPGLKHMDMSGSGNLKEIPDLSMATNLETLYLPDCKSLVELPSSIQHLNKLEKLDLSYCTSFETFPVGINLRSLYVLNVYRCSRLKTFPDLSTNVSNINVSYSGIEEFPSNLRLENLASLYMTHLKSTKTWKLVEPLAPLMNMLSSPSHLTKLYLSDIPGLVTLPSCIQNFSKLECLMIRRCTNLETLPTGINLQSLDRLTLDGCSRLRSFPDISTNISTLSLNRTAIEEVPWSIEDYSNLTSLRLRGCNSLQRVNLNISKLKHLNWANFSNCGALTEVSLNGSSSGVAATTDTIRSSLPCDYFPKVKLNFFNCFNLDKEALLQQPSVFFNSIILSGEEVPSYFTHRTMTGPSLTNIPLLHTTPSQLFFRFRACAMVSSESIFIIRGFLLVIQVCCRFIDRLGVADHFDSADFQEYYFLEIECPSRLLFVFDCCFLLNKENSNQAEVNYDHVDVQFQLTSDPPELKLKGCGIRLFEDNERSDDNDPGNEIDHIYSEDCDNNDDNDLGSEPDTGCWVFLSSLCSFLSFNQ